MVSVLKCIMLMLVSPKVQFLAQLLFLIFINDLLDDILSKIGIYADDTTLYSNLSRKSDFFSKVELARHT